MTIKNNIKKRFTDSDSKIALSLTKQNDLILLGSVIFKYITFEEFRTIIYFLQIDGMDVFIKMISRRNNVFLCLWKCWYVLSILATDNLLYRFVYSWKIWYAFPSLWIAVIQYYYYYKKPIYVFSMFFYVDKNRIMHIIMSRWKCSLWKINFHIDNIWISCALIMVLTTGCCWNGFFSVKKSHIVIYYSAHDI